MNKFDFCQSFVRLNRRPITFESRPYLPAIYEVENRNLVIRASRQVEKSTFLANSILYELMSPDARILFVCPRDQQARVFSQLRFRLMLSESALLRRYLLGGRKKCALPI